MSKDLPELQHLGFHLLFAKGTIKDTGQKAFHLQSSSAPLSDTSSPHLTGHCPLRGLLCLLRAALCPVRRLLCHCYGSSSNMHQTAPSLQASTCHSRGLRPPVLTPTSCLRALDFPHPCPGLPVLQGLSCRNPVLPVHTRPQECLWQSPMTVAESVPSGCVFIKPAVGTGHLPVFLRCPLAASRQRKCKVNEVLWGPIPLTAKVSVLCDFGEVT